MLWFSLLSLILEALKSSNSFLSCLSVSDRFEEYSVSVELLSFAEGLKVSSLSLSSNCSPYVEFLVNFMLASGMSSSEELVMSPASRACPEAQIVWKFAFSFFLAVVLL